MLDITNASRGRRPWHTADQLPWMCPAAAQFLPAQKVTLYRLGVADEIEKVQRMTQGGLLDLRA